MNRYERNVLIGYTHPKDKKIFFGPIEKGDIFHRFPLSTNFPRLLKHLEIFDSTSEASRSGYNLPIPEGYSEWHIKRSPSYKTKWIYILKISSPMPWTQWLRLWFPAWLDNLIQNYDRK